MNYIEFEPIWAIFKYLSQIEPTTLGQISRLRQLKYFVATDGRVALTVPHSSANARHTTNPKLSCM